MMNRGEIIEDIAGDAKQRLEVDDLFNRFTELRQYERITKEILSMLQEGYY